MAEYKINRDKKDLIKFMKTKSEKIGLQCKFENDKVVIEAKPGADMYSQTPIPVIFKGEFSQEDCNTVIIGRFTYGFYLTTLVIVAVFLIVVRFAWSLYKMQMGNMILCGIVTFLLVIVCAVVNVKGKPLKGQIVEFLENLDKK